MDETKKYWKGLEELHEDPSFLEERSREFKEELSLIPFDEKESKLEASRRDFLKLMGFSFGGLALSACTRMPVEKIIPYLNKPEEIVPGVANWYATTCAGCTASCSILTKVRDGRPIKIEGNAESPLFQGGVCAVGQATVLSLYDEARLKEPSMKGKAVAWDSLDHYVLEKLQSIQSSGGRLLLVAGTTTSPSTKAILQEWKVRYPNTEVVSYDAFSQSAIAVGYEKALGVRVIPHFHLDRARRIVSFGADFLGTWISPVEFAKAYSKRRIAGDATNFSRHVQFESGLSLTGSNADKRVIVSPSEQLTVIQALLKEVERQAGRGSGYVGAFPQTLSRQDIESLAKDLWAHQGESVVLCGLQSEEAQTMVALINGLLQNVGVTVDLSSPSHQKSIQDANASFQEVIDGKFDGIIFYGANPLYHFQENKKLENALKKLKLTVSLSDHLDETSFQVDVVAPDHHFLESWNDAEPVSGYLSLSQPTIRPLFQTRSAQESLLRWMGNSSNYYDYLRNYWEKNYYTLQLSGFTSFWDRCVQYGFLNRTSTEVKAYSLNAPAISLALAEKKKSEGLEIQLYESIALRDGRQANNPWLQELPDPVTKMCWDNYASLSSKMAASLGVIDGDVIRITEGEKEIEIPVQIQPGQQERTVSIAVGYGREKCGKAGERVGVNVFPFLTSHSVKIEKTMKHVDLAATQTHHSMEGREIVREASLADFLKNPKAGNESVGENLVSLWEEAEKPGHYWGMVVDLTNCIGCSACVVSCQAENNVPVVGKDEVLRRREMHWIRIDRYYTGAPENPETVYQPMMCQHCGNAPCETVCPVLATVHSSDGLNQQVYNRCVGTRYCANNCPYKVRRFNWFDYAKNDQFDFNMNSDLGTMVLNPDIVVRSRGVMEKCSMCVQRIQEGRLEARKQGIDVKDGDIKLACEQSCPSNAITFGDLQNPESRVAKMNQDGRFYHVLEELNVKPGIGYLTKIRNRGEG